MVTHQPKDGHPRHKKEVYYRLGICHLHNKTNTGCRMPQMVTIHRMVPHRPKDGHPPTNLRMVTHHEKEVYYRFGI